MNESHDGVRQLTREVRVVQIPMGTPLTLPAGAEVVITQALGGSFTIVVPTHAGLYRVAGIDADALGLAPEAAGGVPVGAANAAGGAELTPEQVWTQLKSCYDPEIPVNIVDLGLVYDMEIRPGAEAGKSRVEVKMTLTAPGCGMGPAIAADAQNKIEALPGVEVADVQVVWDPPWNPGMISEEGRMKLGMV